MWRPSWRDRRIEGAVAGACVVAALVTSLSSVDRLVEFAREHAWVLPDEVVRLQRIETLGHVKGINVVDTDNFTLLWSNYFTMRKRQVYQRFPYSGRPVGAFAEDYVLTKTEAGRTAGNLEDMLSVDTSRVRSREDLTPWFAIYRSSERARITIGPDSGWLQTDGRHHWCGPQGGSCTVWIEPGTPGVRVWIEATVVPLRDGDEVALTVNGEPVRVSGARDRFVTEPFALRAGRNIVRLAGARLARPPGRIPTDESVGWQALIVRLADDVRLAGQAL
jgi:hypothetical protein